MSALRRAVWTEGGLTVEAVEPPPLPHGWARLRVEACGICGTDLGLLHGELPRVSGTVPGHEFVGTVLDGPAGLPDARYAANPMVTCGTCEHCRAGEWNLCRRGGAGVGLGRDGGLADWVDVPVGNLVRLDGSIDATVGMLTEPTAVAVRGVGLAGIAAGDPVAVIGAGTIGLLAAAVARTRTDDVVLSVRHPHQADAARRLGLETVPEADTMAWGKEARPVTVIETAGGDGRSLDTALRIARRGGQVLVLGTFRTVGVDLFVALQKEVTIRPSYAYGNRHGTDDLTETAATLIELRHTIGPLVTHRFGLDDALDAFATAGDKATGAIKVAVVPDEPSR
jgi:threonine dehydrogenase-like Zn-dependent dehydrogenase